MAGNTMTLEFAGDADKLQRAAKQAQASVDIVAKASKDAGSQFSDTAQNAGRFEQRMGSLGSATTGLTDAVDTLGGGLQALVDVQDAARQQAQRLARAAFDVADAQENMRQATRDAAAAQNDGKRAALDMEIALLDQKEAQDEYNKAVKEHGKNSDEAKRALTDVKAAGLDYAEAQEDANQAIRDGERANLDATEAQLNMNDAMHEANPPELQQWADKLNLITPLLTALIGITSLVTAAQWLFNASLWANPITWVVIGIIALIAVIVLLVKNWDKVREAGTKAWTWIKDKASGVWEWMKKLPGKIGDVFSGIGSKISAPFRAAFNWISDAWNNTIGQLSWHFPGAFGVGAFDISAPRLPRFHTGGVVPGLPGQEVPIMALAGETVLPAGRSGASVIEIRSGGTQLDDLLVEMLSRTVRRRGGNVQRVLGGRNA